MQRPFARGLNVLTTFEQLELPRPGLADAAAGPVLWAGPCLGQGRPQVTFPWERLEGTKPLVYVSLGTVFNAHREVYVKLLQGVHAAGARAVVAAGASLRAAQHAARSDDVVLPFVPQIEVLERVHAAVVHGGNNSTNEALCAARPLLVVPFGGEQVANARRVVALGVGRALDPAGLQGEAVSVALASLLRPDAAERSRALSASLPTEEGVTRVVTALEALV